MADEEVLRIFSTIEFPVLQAELIRIPMRFVRIDAQMGDGGALSITSVAGQDGDVLPLINPVQAIGLTGTWFPLVFGATE
jgi:hypothetical protein